MTRGRGILCVGIVIGLFAFGLWPLDFVHVNAVVSLKDGSGLRFEGREFNHGYSNGGMLYTRNPIRFPEQTSIGEYPITMVLWLRSLVSPQGGRTRIVSICHGFEKPVIFLDQWRSHLLVCWRITGRSGKESYKEIGIRNALYQGVTRFITITSGDGGTDVYLGERHVRHLKTVFLIKSCGSLARKTLVVGNSLDGTHSWSGDIFGMGLYAKRFTGADVKRNLMWWKHTRSKSLKPSQGICSGSVKEQDLTAGTYLMSQELKSEPYPPFGFRPIAVYCFNRQSGDYIPDLTNSCSQLYMPHYLRFNKRFFSTPNSSCIWLISFFKDAIVNVLGFMPFSFFLLLWLDERFSWSFLRMLTITIFSGFLISFVIELIQGCLLSRDSSLVDLFNNTLGTILGTLVFFIIRRSVDRRADSGRISSPLYRLFFIHRNQPRG